MEHNDPHLNILLDIQKQLGVVNRETGEQSKMLIALNEKVAIQNGRVTKAEQELKKVNSILDNWKGRLAIIVVIAGFLGNVIISWVKKELNI